MLIDQPTMVRADEQLDAAKLASYLRQHLPEAATDADLVIEQFPRGFSNLTYLLRIGERELVLRRPPFGAQIKSAHDMGREYKILHALSPVYPKAPRPLLYCADESMIGAPFYVMERVRGLILRNRLPEGVVMAPAQMRALGTALIDTLAELHAVDFRAAGLGDLGRPEGYVERQVTGWLKRYQNARTHDLPDLERASAWLLAHLPGDGAAALIHNDFKYDNVIFNPQILPTSHSPLTIDHSQLITAVLDWEMATIGDPLMDLGTTLGYWSQPDDLPELRAFGLTSQPGNLTRAEVIERYAQQSGRDLGNIRFYYVFGLVKIAIILQQIYFRYRQGFTHDARFATLDRLVAAGAATAAREIDRGA